MKKVLWNDGWQFSKRPYDEKCLNEVPTAWESVDLPHDWLIYDTENLYEDSIGWYRKVFNYHPENEKAVIRFEAVYMDSAVFLNGEKIREWKYGYSTFDVDLTGLLLDGENELLVRVVHQAPNSRWYSGAGIIRDVFFCTFPPVHFVMDGVYITPEKNADGTWKVLVEAEVSGDVAQAEVRIFGPTGESIGSGKIPGIVKTEGEAGTKSCTVPSDCTDRNESTEPTVISHEFTIEKPLLWDIGQGNLYRAELTLWDKNGNSDEISDTFGLRTIEFDPEKGFFINGRHEKIKGSCEHHGFSCLGGVASRAALKKKLLTLREMGVNAIRTAHNMPSAAFMELADELGFLVDTESFDCWSRPKTTYDYARFFQESFKKDIASWVRRDRNHPSIIMWSAGNEIYDMHEGPLGYEELKVLVAEIKRHDPKGHAKITFASNYMRWENAQRCVELVDLAGYNYGEYLYDEHHAKHPDWIIYGSETSSMLASRGVYHFPLEKDILCEDDEQCSALGNSFAGWGAHDYTDNIIADRDRAFSLGQFIWTGFDYFGEPTPYHTRNSYFGNVDTAGFKKDAFYIYQAEWTDYRTAPMVHVFPYWDFNEGQIIDVCVCSNAPTVELFVNGRSLGRKQIDHQHGTELVPNWSVPYEKGEIKAIAYDENGRVIAAENRHSFGEAKKLVVKKERIEDLIFCEISAVDDQGNPVENANRRVRVQVSGGAELLGLDNGDSTDFEQVRKDSRRLFQGKLLAIARVKENAKEDAKENAKEAAKGNAKEAAEEEPLITAKFEEEIPIRKIELLPDGDLAFHADRKSIALKVRILPENATYQDIQVKIVNDIGIPLQSAEWALEGDMLHVTAKGDGEFWLRVNAMNGRENASVRSCLKFTASGLGQAFMNPYERISGGLCLNRAKGLSEGVEQGVRFLGKEKTRIYFDRMDFGKAGSREMTMELFKYTVEPVKIRIYDEEEDTLLCESVFSESAKWLEFKEHRVRIPDTVKGVKRIAIESSDNFQLRAFRFSEVKRGYENTWAKDCDEIFGDSYTLTGENVENIGNNTTLVFTGLDFSERPVHKIRFCGRTSLPNTTIHLKAEGVGINETELLEFGHSSEYTEREFAVREISGEVKLSFVFLPGSQFDFAYFRVE